MEQVKPQPVMAGAARQPWLWSGLLITLLLIALVTAFSPMERILGANARLIYFHGAWVWAGKIAFGAASLAGLLGLIRPRSAWQRYSLALGRSGLFFWLTYLPLSLYVQQVNWGGIFWDEPRWRIPLMFGVAGLLLQIALWLMDDLRLASIVNIIFGVALWWALASVQNVLHPDSPITQSNATDIQIVFGILIVLSLIFGAILTRLIYNFDARSRRAV